MRRSHLKTLNRPKTPYPFRVGDHVIAPEYGMAGVVDLVAKWRVHIQLRDEDGAKWFATWDCILDPDAE